MDVIEWVKYVNGLEVQKQVMVEFGNTIIHVTPQAFNALIVYTSSNQHRATSRSTLWMVKHKQRNANILSSSV